MKAFRIADGDLVIGAGGYATVAGPDKLFQDLSIAVREPFGSDRFHPSWGSKLLDSIGFVADEAKRMAIFSEVQRVIQNYAAVQADTVRQDMAAGVRSRFTLNEVLASVDSILITPDQDTFMIKVTLRTMSQEQIELNTSITGG